MKLYYCHHCKLVRRADYEHGREKVRTMRTGFVARFLNCGHIVPVTQKPEGETCESK